MSKIQFDARDEEDKEIMNKVNDILSVPQTEQNSEDKIFLNYLKYIFSNKFTKFSLSSINKKKDKIAYKYLKNYIEILYILFKRDKNERDAFYKTEKSNFSNELANLFSSLILFRKRKAILFDPNNLNDRVYIFFYSYFFGLSNTLSGSLTFFFYCLGLMIPKTNTLKLLLYYFFKGQFPEFFKKFDFEEFCPDLEKNNCLNLIMLYIANVSNNNLEILFIYSLLISKYKYIFRSYEKDIDAIILQESVEQTLDIVKKKTINNQIIGMYIYSYFHYYLQGNLDLYSQESEIETENSISEKEEDKLESVSKKNEINDEKSKYNQTNDITKVSKKTNDNNSIQKSSFEESKSNEFNVIKNINNIIEKPLMKNTNKDNNITKFDSSQKINIEDMDISDSNSSLIKDIIYREEQKGKENKNTISSKEKDINIIGNEKDTIFGYNSQSCQKEKLNELNLEESPKDSEGTKNYISSYIKSNTINDKEKKEKAFNGISSGDKSTCDNTEMSLEKKRFSESSIDKSTHNIIETSIGKISDNINDEEKISADLNQLSDIERLQKEIEDVKRTFQKKFKEKDQEIDVLKEEVYTLKEDMEKLKVMIGSVQVRDFAKTFMSQFKYLLNKNDKNNIKINKKEKWKIIRERVEKTFGGYKQRPKYKSFIELFKKSEKVIKRGNKEAHTINLKIYEKDIFDIAATHQLVIPNSNKLFFLIQLGVSKNLFRDGYQFLDDYFDDNMERRILKESPIENFFN